MKYESRVAIATSSVDNGGQQGSRAPPTALDGWRTGSSGKVCVCVCVCVHACVCVCVSCHLCLEYLLVISVPAGFDPYQSSVGGQPYSSRPRPDTRSRARNPSSAKPTCEFTDLSYTA